MRLIDADYLVNKMISNCPIDEGGIPLKDFDTHQKILGLYPTVDAVEVVRCKDCEWWHDLNCTNINGAYCCVLNGDWFCSSGKRRTE